MEVCKNKDLEKRARERKARQGEGIAFNWSFGCCFEVCVDI